MKAEVYKNGPIIACGIYVSPAFKNYTGGVLKDNSGGMLDRIISVVGWAVENGVECWVGRNSWGTPWDEQMVTGA